MAEEMVRRQREAEPPIPEDCPGTSRSPRACAGNTAPSRLSRRRASDGRQPADRRPLPVIEHYLARWMEIGFPAHEALATILSMGDLIVGAALEYQAEMERVRQQGKEAQQEVWEKMKVYPNLHAAARQRAARVAHDGRYDSFEHGLSLLIAGLRQRHAELMAQREMATA